MLLCGAACEEWILLNGPQFRITTCETVNCFLKFGQRIKGEDENIWVTTDSCDVHKEEFSYFALTQI
jgi:hypothetical protein